MKRTAKRMLSLMLVIAVLMTSMLVSVVGATTPVTTDPMQTVLLQALTLDEPSEKDQFIAALNKTSETTLTNAVNAMLVVFPTMKPTDAQSALAAYKALTDGRKQTIKAGVTLFTLNNIVPPSNLGSIVAKVNTEITGDASDNKGINLIIQIIEKLNSLSENGAWAKDKSSDAAKIAFDYNSADVIVSFAKDQLGELIGSMQTLNTKIASSDGGNTFDKLLNYTAGVINTASNTEIAALKAYLNNIDPAYYVETQTTVTPVTPVAPVVDNTTAAVGALVKDRPADDATGAEVQAFEKALDAAIVKAIEAVGTTAVAPKISGTTATITADQIKVTDLLAKADAVIAKAAELAKATTGTNATIEKKIVIAVDSKGAANVNVSLPTDLFAKIQEKGINTIEIATGDVKVNVAPDFATAIKGSSSVALEVKKVEVSDALKATMTDEQKAIFAGNATVYDFNLSSVATDGKATKITSFDKAIKIKVKYTLKAGENKDSLTVLFLGDDGKIQNMTGRYNETTGEIEFSTNHFSTYVIKNLAMSFNDVTASAWYKTSAESLASKGIVEGRGGNNFKPNANVTRAEFLTMLVKAKGVYDSAATCDFTDVNENAWYYTYVASAVKAGITGGVGDNKFAPNSLITREQMAVMIASALEVKTVDNASSYLTASDASKISAYAKNGMALSVKNEFLVGSDNKLAPKGNATRGMAAVVVYKYFNFIF